MTNNPYHILGVLPTSTDEEIKKAYICAAKLIHPDQFNQPHQKHRWEKANTMLAEVNLAYEILRDPIKRAAYYYDVSVEDVLKTQGNKTKKDTPQGSGPQPVPKTQTRTSQDSTTTSIPKLNPKFDYESYSVLIMGIIILLLTYIYCEGIKSGNSLGSKDVLNSDYRNMPISSSHSTEVSH